MKKSIRSFEPTTMIHHVKEIQKRLLVTVLVLIIGMTIGYFFYEPLFQFIKAPLNGPLHYTSPSGSFNFVVNICLMVGVIVALPVGVYNAIMFVQPALKKRLSTTRVYITTFLSLIFASAGGAFAFLVIIPMALKFFYKFQVDGLVALISADDYLHFVVNVIVTFVVIFQLPLLISVIDQVTPIPPKKLFKAEKYVIIGSVAIGVLVPFALDPFVQLLIASPIIILYNLSIVIVAIQHRLGRRGDRSALNVEKVVPASKQYVPPIPRPVRTVSKLDQMQNVPQSVHKKVAPVASQSSIRQSRPTTLSARPARLITDVRRPVRPVSRAVYNAAQPSSK